MPGEAVFAVEVSWHLSIAVSKALHYMSFRYCITEFGAVLRVIHFGQINGIHNLMIHIRQKLTVNCTTNTKFRNDLSTQP